jgi:hypothetical protein
MVVLFPSVLAVFGNGLMTEVDDGITTVMVITTQSMLRTARERHL